MFVGSGNKFVDSSHRNACCVVLQLEHAVKHMATNGLLPMLRLTLYLMLSA